MKRFADLRRVMLSIWAKVADVDSLSLELHTLRAFAFGCVRTLLALDLHARDRIVVEDEFDGLWRYVTEALVPHVHGSTQGHEISVYEWTESLPSLLPSRCCSPRGDARANERSL